MKLQDNILYNKIKIISSCLPYLNYFHYVLILLQNAISKSKGLLKKLTAYINTYHMQKVKLIDPFLIQKTNMQYLSQQIRPKSKFFFFLLSSISVIELIIMVLTLPNMNI